MIYALLLTALCFLGRLKAQSHLPTCTEELRNRHFPSGFDCESYYTCFDGAYVLQRCPSGFWFDRRTETCRFSSAVTDCEFAPTTTRPPPTQPPTTVSTSTTILQTTTVPLESTTVSVPSGDCPSLETSRHPVEHSCTRFTLCREGVRFARTCSPGLYFSRSQLRCVRREDSDCLIDTSSCPIDSDPNTVIFLPDQEDCQRFFICVNGQPEHHDCGNSLHWEPNDDWCIKEEDSSCVPSYPLPEIREIECPEDTESELLFLPHPEECQFYFICIDGTSILARCTRAMLFDYITARCMFPQDARCFNGSPVMGQSSAKLLSM